MMRSFTHLAFAALLLLPTAPALAEPVHGRLQLQDGVFMKLQGQIILGQGEINRRRRRIIFQRAPVFADGLGDFPLLIQHDAADEMIHGAGLIQTRRGSFRDDRGLSNLTGTACCKNQQSQQQHANLWEFFHDLKNNRSTS